MSSPSAKRRNCKNYRKARKRGHEGGGSSRQRNRWQDFERQDKKK